MNKIIVVVVILALAASAHAKAVVAERILTKAADQSKQDNVAATQLGSGSGCDCNSQQSAPQQDSCGCGSSPSIVSSVSGSGSGSYSSYRDMQEQALANLPPRPSVDEAIRPIADWMKDFDQRTQLHGSLWDAAKSTVAPLIKKLEKSQHEAMDRLRESNRAIRLHVEEAATEHVFNLLRSKKAMDDAELTANQKKADMSDAAESVAAAKQKMDGAKDGVKQLQEAMKKEKQIDEEARKKAGLQGGSSNSTASAVSDTVSKILKS
jgi:hypothetical protein